MVESQLFQCAFARSRALKQRTWGPCLTSTVRDVLVESLSSVSEKDTTCFHHSGRPGVYDTNVAFADGWCLLHTTQAGRQRSRVCTMDVSWSLRGASAKLRGSRFDCRGTLGYQPGASVLFPPPVTRGKSALASGAITSFTPQPTCEGGV